MHKQTAANWCPLEGVRDSSLSAANWQWVSSQDSLTKRLRSTFKSHIEFRLQKAQLDRIYPDEKLMLNLSGDADQWVREIQWRAKANLMIAARVVIPVGSLNPLMRKLYTTGATSIGEVLFQQGGFERENMLFAKIMPGHPYFQMAGLDRGDVVPYLWARCSIFTSGEDRLLVSEMFLPSFFDQVSQYES